MSFYLNDSWLQEVVASIDLPPVSSSVVRVVLPVIEMQLRKLIQQSSKFQRRGKKRRLTVEDFNLALSTNRLEPLYGLLPETHLEENLNLPSPIKKIKLVDLVKQPLPPYPLQPKLSLHWLAVSGVQPNVPENPTQSAPSLLSPHMGTAAILTNHIDTATEISEDSTSLSLASLPKEMQLVYIRIIRALEGSVHSENTLFAVYDALANDPGMQVLVPHICLFIYLKVRDQSKSLDLLNRLMRAVKSLVLNQYISLEYHLQQILPAVFTCVVGSQHLSVARDSIYQYVSDRKSVTSVNPLSVKDSNVWAISVTSSVDDDGWDLRLAASEIISICCAKYSAVFPDLQARVIRTYMEGIGFTSTGELIPKSLNTLYGAIAGISTLGNIIVGDILLPRASQLFNRLDSVEGSLQVEATAARSTAHTDKKAFEVKSKEIRQQLNTLAQLRLLLLKSLGRYMAYTLQSVGPRYQTDMITAKAAKRNESTALSALTYGLAERATMYVAADKSNCGYCCRLFL